MEIKEGTYKIVNEGNKFPHWGWAVFWLVVFWPALIIYFIMGCTTKEYTVIIQEGGKSRMEVVDGLGLGQIKFNYEEEK